MEEYFRLSLDNRPLERGLISHVPDDRAHTRAAGGQGLLLGGERKSRYAGSNILKPRRKPSTFEPSVACYEHALVAVLSPERRVHSMSPQGALPLCQSSSSRFLSRSVSIG